MYHPILHKVGWLNGENCDVLLWLSQWLGIDHTRSIQLHKRKRGKRRRLWLTRTRKKRTKKTQHRSRCQPTWPCPIKLVKCGKIFCYRELVCRQNIFGDVSVFSRNNLQPNKKRISGQATMKSSLYIYIWIKSKITTLTKSTATPEPNLYVIFECSTCIMQHPHCPIQWIVNSWIFWPKW